MRLILSVPLIAIVVAAYNAFNLGGGMLDTDSLLFSWVVPSATEVFFKAGDMFVIAGLVALFFEILKAARAGAGTIADHILSTATLIVALVEFLLVPYCGTVAFFLLMVMALIDVIGGFSVSLLATRRDYTVTRSDGL
jgi:hypothetical protein